MKKKQVTTTVFNYTDDCLKEQYNLHTIYARGRKDSSNKQNLKLRQASLPEDISENMVKKILHTQNIDKTSTRDTKKGDLHSQKEGMQECKCFSSDCPITFSPSSDWDVLYFLDARNWLKNDTFILFRVSLSKTSTEWKNIQISKTQTFEDQAKQGRRPRINWNTLYPKLESHCSKVYEGTFDDIFIPLEVME
jgi:hypothetical protein